MSAVQRSTTPKNKMTAYPTITVNEVRLHEFSVSPPSNAFSEEQAMNLLDDRRVKSVRPLIPYVPLKSMQEEGTLIRSVIVAPRFCRKSERPIFGIFSIKVAYRPFYRVGSRFHSKALEQYSKAADRWRTLSQGMMIDYW